MIKKKKEELESHELAVKLYDTWVRDRQNRQDIKCSDDLQDLEELSRINHESQLVEPRRKHLQQMKEVAKAMTIADKVALLVMMELPVLETSTLLHRLSIQLTQDPAATYFSRVNMADNCGSGCG
jgi:hypothetical protein